MILHAMLTSGLMVSQLPKSLPRLSPPSRPLLSPLCRWRKLRSLLLTTLRLSSRLPQLLSRLRSPRLRSSRSPSWPPPPLLLLLLPLHPSLLLPRHRLLRLPQSKKRLLHLLAVSSISYIATGELRLTRCSLHSRRCRWNPVLYQGTWKPPRFRAQDYPRRLRVAPRLGACRPDRRGHQPRPARRGRHDPRRRGRQRARLRAPQVARRGKGDGRPGARGRQGRGQPGLCRRRGLRAQAPEGRRAAD